MAYDAAGTQFEVKPQLSGRARFALDLAKHANEPYGEKANTRRCALARFFGGLQPADLWARTRELWPSEFAQRFDNLERQPTGFDCLTILNAIP